MQWPCLLSPFSLCLKFSHLSPTPHLLSCFSFFIAPFYLCSSRLWPQLPSATAAVGWIGGLDPSLHTRVCVAQLYCERPTHTEFRYIEAHSSRCHWCFCGKLAMSPLYSGFPLINQPSGKPSLSASTFLVPSLPRTVGWVGGGGGVSLRERGTEIIGFVLSFPHLIRDIDAVLWLFALWVVQRDLNTKATTYSRYQILN